MKLALPCLLVLVLMTGCSQGDGQANWDRINRNVENFTELTALIAFSRDDVKPHKESICAATSEVTNVLENFNDPDATFEAIRGAALNAIKDLPADILPGSARPIAILVVDQVLDVVFVYVEDSYMDLLEKNEAVIALNVAKSAARGLDEACDPTISPFSTGPQGLGKFNVEKK